MRRLFVSLLLAATLLAACGGGSSKAKTAAPAAPATSSAPQSTASTTPPKFSGSGGSSWCDLDRSLENSSNLADMQKDPHAWVNQVNGILSKAESKAPSAIKDDVKTVASGLRTLMGVLSSDNYDFTKVTPAQMAPLQDPKLQAASQRITAYDTQVCGTKG